MAIVTNYAEEIYGVPDANVPQLRGEPDYAQKRGNRYIAGGSVANLAGDNNGSKYRLCRLPSNCILHPDTVIDLQSWGFTVANLGTDLDPDALLAVADTSALSDVSNPITLFGATWNKPLWEQLGMSSDPGGEIEISIHTAADAGGAGSADFEFHYLHY